MWPQNSDCTRHSHRSQTQNCRLSCICSPLVPILSAEGSWAAIALAFGNNYRQRCMLFEYGFHVLNHFSWLNACCCPSSILKSHCVLLWALQIGTLWLPSNHRFLQVPVPCVLKLQLAFFFNFSKSRKINIWQVELRKFWRRVLRSQKPLKKSKAPFATLYPYLSFKKGL